MKTKITYHCPKCGLFADKKRGYYDCAKAASCISHCNDCYTMGESQTKWLDDNGAEIVPETVTMPQWPRVYA